MANLERRGPFRQVYVCTSCGHVKSWQLSEDVWWTAWIWLYLAVPVLGWVTLLWDTARPVSPHFHKPDFSFCTKCGEDPAYHTQVAAFVHTSSRLRPWTWGRGHWLFQSEFRKLTSQDGQHDGQELSLVECGRRIAQEKS